MASYVQRLTVTATFCIVAFAEPEPPRKVAESPLPVVLWHGMGDSCCWNHSIGAVANRIRQTLPGMFLDLSGIGLLNLGFAMLNLEMQELLYIASRRARLSLKTSSQHMLVV